jgi:hypothetical protein
MAKIDALKKALAKEHARAKMAVRQVGYPLSAPLARPPRISSVSELVSSVLFAVEHVGLQGEANKKKARAEVSRLQQQLKLLMTRIRSSEQQLTKRALRGINGPGSVLAHAFGCCVLKWWVKVLVTVRADWRTSRAPIE